MPSWVLVLSHGQNSLGPTWATQLGPSFQPTLAPVVIVHWEGGLGWGDWVGGLELGGGVGMIRVGVEGVIGVGSVGVGVRGVESGGLELGGGASGVGVGGGLELGGCSREGWGVGVGGG